MRAERRLRRLAEIYTRRAVRTLDEDEIFFLLRFCRRGLRDGMDSIAPEHQARALPLIALLNGEWS